MRLVRFISTVSTTTWVLSLTINFELHCLQNEFDADDTGAVKSTPSKAIVDRSKSSQLSLANVKSAQETQSSSSSSNSQQLQDKRLQASFNTGANADTASHNGDDSSVTSSATGGIVLSYFKSNYEIFTTPLCVVLTAV